MDTKAMEKQISFRSPTSYDATAMQLLAKGSEVLSVHDTYYYALMARHFQSTCVIAEHDAIVCGYVTGYIPVGATLELWYKNHLEAVYCVAGNGTIEDLASGEVHQIHDGVLYALNNNDRHILRGGTEDMRLICAFNPPVTGRETHDSDGSYELVEED